MNIQATVSGIQLFSGLWSIAEKAEVKLSVLGHRYVYVPGYEGKLPLDALADRVCELWEHCKGEFEETEREPGKRLERKIDWIYEESLRQVWAANYFTIALVILRGVPHTFAFFWNGCRDMSTQFRWEGGGANAHDSYFESYTDNQVRKITGLSPKEAERRGYIWQIYGENTPWKVRGGGDLAADVRAEAALAQRRAEEARMRREGIRLPTARVRISLS